MTQQRYRIGNSSAMEYDKVYASNVARLGTFLQCSKTRYPSGTL